MRTRSNPSWSSIAAMCILFIGGFYTFFGVIGAILGQQVSMTHGYGTSEDLTLDSEKPTQNFGSRSLLSINDFMNSNGTQEYNETLLGFTLPAINNEWSNITLQFTLNNNSLTIDTSLLIGLVSGSWNENITTWNSRPSMGKYVQCQPHKVDFNTWTFDISNLLRSVNLDHTSENLSFFVKLASPSKTGINIYSHRAKSQGTDILCPLLNIKVVNSTADNKEMLVIGISADLIAAAIFIYNYIHRIKSQSPKNQDLTISSQFKDLYRQTLSYHRDTITPLHGSRIDQSETRVCPFCKSPLNDKSILLLKTKGFIYCDKCGSEILS